MQSRRTPLAVLALAAMAAAVAPVALHAQAAAAPAAAADSMAIPRQAVKWFQSSQADSLYANAGEQLKASMQSPANALAMMGRMSSQFGEHKSTDAEVQFDNQGSKIFISVSTYATAPEPVALIVRYTPGSPVIQGFSISPLSRAKERFPDAKLP
jgi:hypothetical protein